MKICKKCGAQYSDDKTFCIDCNEKLGGKLPAEEEQKMREDVSRQIEEMYNKKDPLYVSKFDKVIGGISLLGVAVTLALILVNLFTQQSVEVLVFAIIFFVMSTVEALIPRVSWELEKMRYSLFINGDAEPSDFYLKSRKIAIVCGVVFGVAAFVMSFLQ